MRERGRQPTRKSGEFRKAPPEKDKATIVVRREPLPRGAKGKILVGRAPLPRGSAKALIRTGAKFSVPATEAKNRFGEVLKIASKGGTVFIERHGRDRVVVLDIERYESLVAERRTPDEQRLEGLRKDFDALYARMQTAEAREATARLSEISDDELNRVVARRG